MLATFEEGGHYGCQLYLTSENQSINVVFSHVLNAVKRHTIWI